MKCVLADCPAKYLPNHAARSVCKPYARRLLKADQQIQAIGLQADSKPKTRLCHTMGQSVSASTVLSGIRKTPTPVIPPRRLGVGD